ncbi:MAG TPA: competence/damage-inducible protein A [Flavobacterium sp.]|nr:competence/damage-inducible protein A [Flavobacterium sp.]
MQAAIVTIGDELLIGQVVDTNSVFIGKELERIGCRVVEKTTISDTVETISETMKRYQNEVDIVILTGGLGPTKDDVTKTTFAQYFDDNLILNHEVYGHVKEIIEGFYKRPITEVNKQQAFVPSKCHVLFNKVGTAPGMLMKKEQTTFVSLPGVPFEMKYLITEKLIPYIKKSFSLDAIVHTTVLTYGIGESLLAETIEDWENSLAELDIKLAYLPKFGMVRLRLSRTGRDLNQINKEIAIKIEELKTLIPDFYAGISEGESFLEEITRLLKEKQLTISTAESCTGGSIAQQLTSLEGSSAYFKGSAVTYATESKVKILGVQQNTIDQYSVVSEQVAQEMAEGVRDLYQSDIAISTTGNAGPSKGDSDKEVGTVCIGIAIADNTKTFTFHFSQPRSRVIESTVQKVWLLLYKLLSETNNQNK